MAFLNLVLKLLTIHNISQSICGVRNSVTSIFYKELRQKSSISCSSKGICVARLGTEFLFPEFQSKSQKYQVNKNSIKHKFIFKQFCKNCKALKLPGEMKLCNKKSTTIKKKQSTWRLSEILSLFSPFHKHTHKQWTTILIRAFQTTTKVSLLFFLTSTPRSRRYLTTLIIPLDAAACKGVYDFLSLHVTSAPWATSNFTTSICPKRIKIKQKNKEAVFYIPLNRFTNGIIVQLL